MVIDVSPNTIIRTHGHGHGHSRNDKNKDKDKDKATSWMKIMGNEVAVDKRGRVTVNGVRYDIPDGGEFIVGGVKVRVGGGLLYLG